MARYVTFVLKLRPSCSSVWNLQGLPRSPRYDRSRDWRSRRQPQQEQDLLQMPAGGPCNYFTAFGVSSSLIVFPFQIARDCPENADYAA